MEINYGWLTNNNIKFAPKTTTNQVYTVDGVDLSSKLDEIVADIDYLNNALGNLEVTLASI